MMVPTLTTQLEADLKTARLWGNAQSIQDQVRLLQVQQLLQATDLVHPIRGDNPSNRFPLLFLFPSTPTSFLTTATGPSAYSLLLLQQEEQARRDNCQLRQILLRQLVLGASGRHDSPTISTQLVESHHSSSERCKATSGQEESVLGEQMLEHTDDPSENAQEPPSPPSSESSVSTTASSTSSSTQQPKTCRRRRKQLPPKRILDERWMNMFRLLQEYKTTHGDCIGKE